MIRLDDFSDPTMDPGFADSTGIPGFFIFMFVVVIGIGIVGTVVRVSSARSMARRAGVDADDATAVTLLSPDNGLAATFLASNLKPSAAPVAQEQAGRTVAERLTDLAALRDAGTITEAEYAEQRAAIIDSV